MESYGTAPDGADLQWEVVLPSGVGPWPMCLSIHGGGFASGGPGSGRRAALDLAAEGIGSYLITYRLDKKKLPGQTSTGQWPQQTDDVKMAARAARANVHCNGKLFAIGGSAGATHACSLAIEHETSALWTPNDRVDAAICISGAYKFSGRKPHPALANFVQLIQNYTGTNVLKEQLAMSPVALVDVTARPIFFAQSAGDSMPQENLQAMVKKLNSLGVSNYEATTTPGSLHSFANWPSLKAAATAFLVAHK